MKHLLLLHGALATEKQMQPLAERLHSFFHVHSFSFSGHGGRTLNSAQFNAEYFADEVSSFITSVVKEDVHIFGYSMGGYAALLAALSDHRIRSVATLGTKFDWTPGAAENEGRMLNADKIMEKVPQFAQQLEQLHAPTDWRQLLTATSGMMKALGEHPLLDYNAASHIDIPVFVLCGENDRTAGPEASAQFASWLEDGSFQLMKDTGHPFEKVDMEALAKMLTAFFSN